MKVKVTIPAGNEISKCIAVSANFRAYTHNLKQRLAYIKEWEKSYNHNPCDTFKHCLDYAHDLALKEARGFERLSSNMPEYANHPNYIEAQAVYEAIMKVSQGK